MDLLARIPTTTEEQRNAEINEELRYQLTMQLMTILPPPA